MSFFDTAKETVEDLVHGDPTAELEEFFDVGFSSYGINDLDELRELERNLKSRKESEQKRAERPGRVKQPGQEAKTIAAKAERRIEWLEEKIGGTERRIEEVKGRREELREDAREAQAEAREKIEALAAEALDKLGDVAGPISEMAEARADALEARKKADMPTTHGTPRPEETAVSRMNQLKSILQQITQDDE